MVLSVASPGSKRTTSTGTLGRSWPLPLPWKAIYVWPPSTVRNRWPTLSGTGVVLSLIIVAIDETTNALPSVAPPMFAALAGNEIEAVPRKKSVGEDASVPRPMPFGLAAHETLPALSVPTWKRPPLVATPYRRAETPPMVYVRGA